MRLTTANEGNLIAFNAVAHRNTVFDHPRDVLSNPMLSTAEKRAILASWASDAAALATRPRMRAPRGLRAPVSVDEILKALCALDDGSGPQPPGGKPMRVRSAARLPAAA